MRCPKVMRARTRTKLFFLPRLIKKVNDLLYMACIAEDFVFMDQADITMAHISKDGIHLNSYGTSILLYNIMSVFNSFDGDSIDFKHDYDYAMSLC